MHNAIRFTREVTACTACDWQATTFEDGDESGEVELLVIRRLNDGTLGETRQLFECCPLCMGAVGSAEVTEELPGRWAICGRCDGDGKVDHEAFSNGITADEWHGPDWDDESRETYLRGGYSVPCPECKGDGKVLEPDTTGASPELLALIEEYENKRSDDRAYERERAYERKMGY